MKSRSARTLLFAAVLTFGISACASSEPVRAHDGELQVLLDEFRIRPGAVVASPGRLRLRATNTGRLPHHLAIVTDDDRPREIVAEARTTHNGESAPITIPYLMPGRYRFVCRLANHADLGAYAALVVER